MKLTESMYRLLCEKYQQTIDKQEQLVVQYTQDRLDNPDINNSVLMIDAIKEISEAKDKLEALKDFWIHNKNS
jgi:hypothetical protein